MMRLRIAAAAAVGIALIGLLGWNLTGPCEPSGVVRASCVGPGGAVILVILALAAGFIAYFAAWPYGREVGVLAVPFGLGLWSIRTAPMAALMQLNPRPEQRHVILAVIRFEPLFWLALITAGYAGVLIARQLVPSKVSVDHPSDCKISINKHLQTVLAVIASVVVAQICMSVLATDVRVPDNKMVGQPSVGQIVFAVIVSFAAAAFVVRRFLGADYIAPAIGSTIITAFAIMFYVRPAVIEALSRNWPGVFFSTSTAAILPVQMVAFGAIGAVAGYWLAVRFEWWRRHESQ